jgi:diguanylate cyclase (GGDEF)-like protein
VTLARLLVLALLHCAPALAGVEHYDVSDGLSQNSVVAIASDSRGFLWIGTEDGLNRFDGVDFRSFHRDVSGRGLSGNFIQRLARHREMLWIGTIDGGLSRMYLPEERIEHLAARLPDAAPALQTTAAVLPLSESRALVVTAEGVHRVEWPVGEGEASSVLLQGSGANGGGRPVGDLLRLQDGRVLAAAGAELCLFDAALTTCATLDIDWPEATSGQPIWALAQTADGQLWISFERGIGLVRVDLQRRQSTLISYRDGVFPQAVGGSRALAPAPGNDLWIGTDVGTYRWRADCQCIGARVDAVEGDAASARRVVYALLPGAADQLWIGAWNHGLTRFDPRRQGIERHRPQLPDSSVTALGTSRAFVAEASRLWIGTMGGGVVEAPVIDGQLDGFRQPAELRPPVGREERVWALAPIEQGGLWIGSDSGLWRWRPGAVPQRIARQFDAGRLPNAVRSLLLDRRQRLWVGSETGLFRVAGEPPQVDRVDGLADPRVFALHQARDDRYWIGTWSGVFAFDAEALAIGAELAPEADIRVVWDIADADDGGLWVGTSDGLLHVRRNGSHRRYSDRDGLPNRVIYGIERDADGKLWLSSNRGIARFDPRSGRSVNFGVEDGLQDVEFAFGSHARTPDGQLLFGGAGGFNRIDPRRLAVGGQAPVPVLTAVKVDGALLTPFDSGGRVQHAAPLLQHLQLLPEDRVLELGYAAISDDQPRQLRFRHRLVGFDRDWQEVGTRRFASYTHLAPGSYRFELQASSRFGISSTQPLSLAIEVQPLWWQRGTVQVGAGLLLLLVLGLTVRWRIVELQQQRQRLESEVAERTREIRAQRDVLAAQGAELARVNTELDALSRRDSLTGLLNRRALLEHLALAQQALREHGTPLTLAIADLDHFKRINDSLGHLVGDRALVHLARTWEPLLRAQTLLGRYGGEEFLLIFAGEDAGSAGAIIERLIDRLADTPVPGVRPPLALGVSVGWVVADQPDASPETLLKRADDALYQAKATGRRRAVRAVGG